MKLFKCPNCRLCVDLRLSFKDKLCPMCGIPLEKDTDKRPLIIEEKC